MQDILNARHGRNTNMVPTGQKFPVIEEVLQSTYGFFIYQEQIQKVAEVLAGYSDSEADEFRKIIAKKIREKIPAEKERFSRKASEKGMSAEDINELWNQIEDFGAYCFNLSHALSYSILTVITAYLKVHYSAEFYAANIINDISSQDKIIAFIEEAKLFNVHILPPDINESSAEFSIINNNRIRFGIGGIKGIGLSTAYDIIEKRIKHGNYVNISNFIYRTNIKSNVMIQLVKAGCFDSLANRNSLIYMINGMTYVDTLIELVRHNKNKEYLEHSYTSEWIPLPYTFNLKPAELSTMEKESVGLYLTHNPFHVYKKQIALALETYKIASAANHHNKSAMIIGILQSIDIFKSGKGCKLLLLMESGETKELLFIGEQWKILKSTIKTYISELICASNCFLNKEGDATFCKTIALLEKGSVEQNETIEVKLDNTTYNTLKYIKDKYKPSAIKTVEKATGLMCILKNDHFKYNQFLGYI